jgi:hypothetical protein
LGESFKALQKGRGSARLRAEWETLKHLGEILRLRQEVLLQSQLSSEKLLEALDKTPSRTSFLSHHRGPRMGCDFEFGPVIPDRDPVPPSS